MNQNITQAPAFAAGVEQIKSATPVRRVLGFLGWLTGFNLGREIGESLRHPSGSQIRNYCANTVAGIQVVENQPVEGQPQTFRVQAIEFVPVEVNGVVKFRQSDKEPGTPVRELFVIDAEVLAVDLERARQAAELFVVGWNQCREEVVQLSRASCHQVDKIISVALDEFKAKFKAAQAVEAPVAAVPVTA